MLSKNMTFRLTILIMVLIGVANAEEPVIHIDENKYNVEYHYRTAMRIIPHGFIDQAKDHIEAIHGIDKLISFERSFHIASNSYGFIAYKDEEGVNINLITCSKNNQSFVSVSGVWTKGDWQFDLIKLLELSTKKLEKYDKSNKKSLNNAN